ncbi:hypothetical protein ABZ705_28850, partial [Streptomyces sp. NPDC006984]
KVVLYDWERDIAVLDVPDLRARPLEFAEEDEGPRDFGGPGRREGSPPCGGTCPPPDGPGPDRPTAGPGRAPPQHPAPRHGAHRTTRHAETAPTRGALRSR